MIYWLLTPQMSYFMSIMGCSVHLHWHGHLGMESSWLATGMSQFFFLLLQLFLIFFFTVYCFEIQNRCTLLEVLYLHSKTKWSHKVHHHDYTIVLQHIARWIKGMCLMGKLNFIPNCVIILLFLSGYQTLAISGCSIGVMGRHLRVNIIQAPH